METRSAKPVDSMDVGTELNQKQSAIGMAMQTGIVKGRTFQRIDSIDGRSTFQEEADQMQVATHRCNDERSAQVFGGRENRTRNRKGQENFLNDFEMSGICCHMKRCVSVHILL